MSGKNILLTGGSGVLGSVLVDRINEEDLTCMVNQSTISRPGVRTFRGNISEKNLGLPQASYDELAERIDCVIHSAAVTDFGEDPAVISASNVTGTSNMLEFAARAGAPFYHISTAFVYTESHGDEKFEFNAYEKSKIESEEVVRRSGLPASIIRPSIVVGDSTTGEISRYQGLHTMLFLFMQEMLDVLPGSPECYCDFVPQDYVADAILEIVKREAVGQDFWLTSGSSSILVKRMRAVCEEQFERFFGRPMKDVPLVSSELYDRLILPAFLPEPSDPRRRIMEKMVYFMRYLNIKNPFPSSFEELGFDLPAPDAVLIRNLEHGARLAARSS